MAKRPEISLKEILALYDQRHLRPDVVQEVEFGIKYEGYIKRNQDLITRFQQYEDKKIPATFDYTNIDKLMFPEEFLEKGFNFYYYFRKKEDLGENNWDELVEEWGKKIELTN